MRRTRLYEVAVVAGIALILGSLLIAWVYFPGRAFDRAKWHDEWHIQRGDRREMADRLIARGTLIGKNREEIVEMLGEALERKGFEPQFVFYLGQSRSFMPIDTEYLFVTFDADGRVSANTIELH